MASLMGCNHSWLYYIFKARTFVFKDLASGLSVCKWEMLLDGSEGWGSVDGFIKLPTPSSSSGLYRACIEGSGVWYSSGHEALVLQPHTRSCPSLYLKDTPAGGNRERLSCVVFSKKTWHCQSCNTKLWLSPGTGHTPTQSRSSVPSGYRVTGFSNTVLRLRTQNKHEIGCLSVKVHTCHH